MCSHQCWLQGKEYLPHHASSALNTARCAGALCCKRALLFHVQWHQCFLQCCVPASWLPVFICAWVYSYLGVEFCASYCWISWSFYLLTSLAEVLPRSLWEAVMHLVCSPLPDFLPSACLLRVCLVLLSRKWIKLNGVGQDWPPAGLSATDCSLLGVTVLPVLSPPHSHLNLLTVSLCMRMLLVALSKTFLKAR